MAQPSLSEQIRRLEAELGVSLFARAGRRARADRGGAAAAPAGRADARRGARGRRVGPRGPRRRRRHGRVRHLRQRAPLPARRARGRTSARATRRCGSAWSARTRSRSPTRCATGGSRRGWWCCRSTTAGSTCGPRCARRSSTSAPSRARLREPMTIERLGERAADPLRRALGRRRPDAPPAARARPARRRQGRAGDRGRVHHRGARPRRARARRHAGAALDRRLARLAPAAERRAVRPAAVRHLRLHHPPQRAALPGHAGVHAGRRAPGGSPEQAPRGRRGRRGGRARRERYPGA